MSETTNPLLAKVKLPGKRFRLPSKGLFYNDGEIDESVVDGEIEVFSMTTIDEIILRSPEFLFNGEAIERVFTRCVPEIKKPLRLLATDVDFVLACLRIVSYGGTYQIHTRCPDCETKQDKQNRVDRETFLTEVAEKAEAQNIEFETALDNEQVQSKLKLIDSKQSTEHTYNINLAGIVQNNTVEVSEGEMEKYTVTLSNDQVVHMTPMKMDSAVATHQFQNKERDIDLTVIEEFISFMIASTILSVDNETDWDMICEWATVLPLKLKRELEEKTKTLMSWGTDFTYIVKCLDEKCDHEHNISTLLNPITFFMTPSESEEPRN